MTQLPYNPELLPRELQPFFISLQTGDLQQMLATLNCQQLDDLFQHLPTNIRMDSPSWAQVPNHLSYQQTKEHLEQLAQLNSLKISFLGDALPTNNHPPEIVWDVLKNRGLATAYTPYQPELSQGTLIALWIYANVIQELTGFEAVNASMYDRASALFEACSMAVRASKERSKVLILESILPQDLAVVRTYAQHTSLEIITIPLDPTTGTTNLRLVEAAIGAHAGQAAALVIPQLNSLGLWEDVNALTDMAHHHQLKVIAIVDPALLIPGVGLQTPREFGQQGADIFVAEGQHLACTPNYGGPGLGIFGVRYHGEEKNFIRHSPGRYVGAATDGTGTPCYTMVLSTREQHIRREKATSNICSNQSFLATITGAALLQKGCEGMKDDLQKLANWAQLAATTLPQTTTWELAFPMAHFLQEVVFALPNTTTAAEVIEQAAVHGIWIGVDVSGRVGDGRQLLKMSFHPGITSSHWQQLLNFCQKTFPRIPSQMARVVSPTSPIPLPLVARRKSPCQLPAYSLAQLRDYYHKLGELNVSPDDNLYPLGSCTMKYNPYLNEYTASLPGFSLIHPQAPLADAQGCLAILYQIQEHFKAITGLAAVTTQPMAGAQGELVGLKMFQAYHHSRGEGTQRQILLIPRSAHGTNPASAAMAGIETKKVGETVYGIVTLEANAHGMIDQQHFQQCLSKYGKRICGIMITNPNTAGIFESNFQEIAQQIHEVGGLVYMDGANMNAIAGHVDLGRMGVDAVHNNLHKTWSIPHGGGGPGDAIVAVSTKLQNFLPGAQIAKTLAGQYKVTAMPDSIGQFHRHWGNFAHKIRAYTYLRLLGNEGIKKMSAVAVLSARYLLAQLQGDYATLPKGAEEVPRMHEFILTLTPADFARIEQQQIPKASIIPQIGKLFLDFGFHAPTVAFPEIYGLMFEPTECFSKQELDRFILVVKAIKHLIIEHPTVLATAPHFAPIRKVDEVAANKQLHLNGSLIALPTIPRGEWHAKALQQMPISVIVEKILEAHQRAKV